MSALGLRVLAALLVAHGCARRRCGRNRRPRGPPPAPQPARQSAALDLTGQWVAIVNEDWRWRMVTPPKGDYASVPLNAEGRRVADTWEPAKDGACEAYGAAGLMRMPTRLRVSWDGDETLKVETDAGQQTRTLSFKPAAASAPRSLQGAVARGVGASAGAARRPGLAGAGGGARPCGRLSQGHDDESLAGLAAQERSAVQRERVAHRVFRSIQGAERRRMVDGHGDRRRPDSI